ncbi:MAG: DUF4405 domain-containing protein [Thermococcus sp.]|uniref:Flavinylation-associated cytochrome domain-containing protein n=1 Tax=Thermococcus guaymasensis DSM 11113 TaxID=1432656 RepID=A0A0X1KKC3_9EURY|nr:DUF4405 domain-containing protein [Thermococcus guaymasensis]AJC71702.1 hypothetical protein X802_05620 [Thermococcus guaymasensis DSM 11113]MCD6525250.1 DUF4405 domain-containing protein [Thermococcus sp.]
MNIVKARAILSTVLLVVFLGVLFVTVGVFYTTKTGHPFLGMNKNQLFRIRNVLGPLMNALIIVHLGLNWGMYKSELKVLFRK